MEEREPLKGSAEDDQESVCEFKNLREVEHVSPEEERSCWWGVRWQADDPTWMSHVVNGGESASNGHGEGEEEGEEVVNG